VALAGSRRNFWPARGFSGNIQRVMQRRTWLLAAALLAAGAQPACSKKEPPSAGAAEAAPKATAAEVRAGQAIFVSRCAGCHTIGSGDRTGPDLKFVTKRREHDWLVKWIKNPVAMGDSDHIGKEISARYGGVIMPNLQLTNDQIDHVLKFVADASDKGGFNPPPVPARKLEGAELEKAQSLYFDRCAGCHGSLRQGALGPKLTPERAREIGTLNLRATLNHGRPGGMPNWGELGILSNEDVDLLANFIQMPPVRRPDLPASEIKKLWNPKIPPKQRPKSPAHKRNWKNFFAIVLRDPGQIAIVDGDTKERLSILDVGFGIELVRASASGRYLYTLLRDGRISAIDLWANPPTVTAQSRGCFDARSLEVSRTKTQTDKLLVEGCYWPPQLVVFDGATLEPKAVLDTRPKDGAEKLDEVRVGTIVAPSDRPLWAATLMESGEVALVDYGKPGFPITDRIPAEPQLLDGGLDHTERYFISASPGKNELSVVDLAEKKAVAKVAMGKTPHPDPGASFEDPELGWVYAVPHVGEANLSLVGEDPAQHPERAWKVVRRYGEVAAGSLNVRTHAKSRWLWVDSPANRSPDLARQICAIEKKTGKLERCWKPRDAGRVIDFQYDQEGTEVWVAGWDKRGAILVYDDAAFKETTKLEGDWLVTPTRIYNVGNAARGND